MASSILPGSKPRKRWMRISLRGAMMLVAVLAICLAYVGNLRQRQLQQRRIIAAIAATGGTVRYTYEFDQGEELSPTSELNDRWYDYSKEGQRRKRSHTLESGETISEVETPPGSALLRRLLGDDVLADVETVDADYLSERPRAEQLYDPQLLLQLPQLKVVTLHDAQLSDEWLATVAQVPDLMILSLLGGPHSTATPRGLAQLRQAKNLKMLSVSGDWVTDEIVDEVAHLQTLQNLAFVGTPNVKSGVFRAVGDLADLRILSVCRVPLADDRGAESLSRLTKLRSFQLLRQPLITDETLRHLAELTELERLILAGTNVSDQGLAHLGKLTRLRHVALSDTPVGDQGLAALEHLPELRLLALDGTQVTDAGVPVLVRMTQLESLDLSFTEVQDAGALLFRARPEFQRLSLGPHISLRAANEIRQGWQHPRNLERVDKDGFSGWPDMQTP